MTGRGLRALRARLGAEDGVTLSEMIIVMVILLIVLAGMTTLFLSASNSQIDQTNRVNAQQEARLALDSLRREIHCANTLTYGTLPASSITISLGSYCPTAAGAPTVTWCTQTVVASARYALWRYPGTAPASCGVTPTGGRVKRADYLTEGQIFKSYEAPNPANRTLATLGISLPVDVTPADAKQRYTLTDDIVLRNSGRG